MIKSEKKIYIQFKKTKQLLIIKIGRKKNIIIIS